MLHGGASEGVQFGVELIDTWNMTVTPLSRTFETSRVNGYELCDKSGARIPLPDLPGTALRVQRIE